MAEEEPAEPPAVPIVPLDRNTFEDNFPIMFQFYKERGKLSDEQHLKVQEIQSRWKAGLVFWLTSDNKVIEIPDWVAMNVVINNKTNIFRSSRICMSLNHTKGYGCNRLAEGTCSYIHECVLCGQTDHGVFQKRPNGSLICKRLRKWNEEEESFKNKHGDTHSQEDKLTELALSARLPERPRSTSKDGSDQAASPKSQPSRHPEQMQKVKSLMGIAGCSEQQALDLLVASRWNIQLAADSYFEGDTGVLGAAGAGAGGWGLGWSPNAATLRPAVEASRPQPQTQAVSTPPLTPPLNPVIGSERAAPSAAPGAERALTATATPAATATDPVISNSSAVTEELPPGVLDLGPPWEDSTPSPPPAQPPPPRMPQNWQALWSEQHNQYYFWHIPTSKTTWEAPSLENQALSPSNGDAASAGSSGTASTRAVGEAVSGQPSQRSDSIFSTAPAALSGLPGLAGGSLCGSLGSSLGPLQMGQSDCEQRAPSTAQRALPAASTAPSGSGSAVERRPPGRLPEPDADQGFKERSEAERAAEELWSCREGHYICTQHWWPPEGADTCMRLFHGEHVTITWTDGKESGWAYGHIIDDPTHGGYFPQAVLKEVKRPPRRRGVGEAYSVVELFEAPVGVSGYLTVSPGDVLKVLHPVEPPSVWVYVESKTPSASEVGWVPEAVLNSAHPAG